MRAVRAVLIGLGALLLLLVAAVWVVPGLLDWNRYRGSIEALASAGVGRPVRIEGDVTLQLLPQPVLTASSVQVADAGDGVALTARELRLRVALGPLLAGRMDARELVVRGADLILPWPPGPGGLSQRPPAWLTGLQARVEESRLTVGGLVLTGIDSTLAVDADTGTLSAAGSAAVAGKTWRFTARLARPGRDGAAGLEWSVDGQGPLRDTGGTFSGQLAADGALSGRVAGRGPDLSQLLPAPAVSWRAEGRLSAATDLAIADELSLEVGGSPARGAVALRVAPEARLDLALAASRLDLDAWLPVLLRGTALAIPTGIDLSAEAATLAGGTLRRLRGAFDLTNDGVMMREAAAILPGGAQLTLAGRTGGGRPAFEGWGSLAAPDLRATLRWLEPLAPTLLAALPSGALQSAELTGRIVLDAGQFSLADARGALDGEALGGGLSVRFGARPVLAAGLTIDRLALDPWLPAPAALADAGAIVGLAQRFAGFDLDVHLQAKQASWLGAGIERLVLDVRTEAAKLTLRRLDAMVLGVRVGASGTVGEAGRVSEGSLEMTAADLATLRPLAPAGWSRLPLLLRGAGSARLQFAGPPDALAVRMTLDLADLRVEAQPVLNLAARHWAGPVTLRHPGAPRLLEVLGIGGTAAWLGDGSLSLLAQVEASGERIALEGIDLAAGAMRLGGQLTVEGLGGDPAVTGRIVAEVLPLPLLYVRSPDPLPLGGLRGWQAALRVEAAQLLVGLTPVMRQLAANVALESGTLRIDRATAELSGGALSGSIVVDTGAEPPRLSLQAAIAGAALSRPAPDLPLDVASGVLDAQANLSAAGHSPAALLATLSGTAQATVRDGVLSGIDLSGAGTALARTDPARLDAELRAALQGGASPFGHLALSAELGRGVLSLGDAQLLGPAGTVRFTGTADLSGGTLDLRAALRPTLPSEGPERAPELGLRLTGPAAEPRRTPELAALARWLADRPP